MFASKDLFLTLPSGGYNIARSVRLRSSATAYLNRTPASSTSSSKYTVSMWVKLGAIQDEFLFGAGASTANQTYIRFYSGGSQAILWETDTSSTTNWAVQTNAVYRDPSAWYHLVFAYDSSLSGLSNQAKIYVNGVQTSVTTSGSGTNSYVNTTVAHYIGRAASTTYFDGYITEAQLIDGQALTPNSFGTINSYGVWQPITYGGSYGTNGFYLPFTNTTSATTLAYDFSPNGNNWTPNNISTTAGVTYDSMTDVPTLTSATAANYCVGNPLDNSGTLSNGNLTFVSGGSNQSNRSTFQLPTSGKFYAECTLGTTTSGSVGEAFGYATADASLTGTPQSSGKYVIYADSTGAIYSNGSTLTSSLGTFASGTILQIAYDGTTGNAWVGKNNTWYNSSGGTTGDPSTGANPTFTSLTNVFPFTQGVNATQNLNFGQRPFTYTPPTGFVALNTYNLPASTITNGAGYMAATLYTGNGTSQSISNAVNGVSFQPDFVWVKDRSVARSNTLWDSVRGIYKVLYSNNTNAEGTDTTALTAFNSNGFSVGADNGENANGETFVGWQWKAGGTSASNTNGSITSTVSAGATQGFSVVTYTGTGSTATVGHGLGVAPNMVIVKSRSTAGTDWPVYHSSLGATGILALDSTIAFTTLSTPWNNTAPTSSVFTVGTSGDTNLSTRTYVAYCFAAVAGYSAFGSYTGNGSADGPFVYTNMRSRFVMIKRTDSAGYDWVIYDTSRSTYNAVTLNLDPNSSAAETNTGSSGMDITSNGFKLRDGSLFWNASGGTYIYMAFAEVPFKSALAR